MPIVVGTALVLATWAVAAACLASIGLPLALVTAPRAGRSPTLRRALWWGLGIVGVLALLVSLLVPLHHPAVGIGLALLAVALGIPGWRLWARRGGERRNRPNAWAWVVGALLVAQIALAVAALGPVLGYDTGLYHLAAVTWAAQFPAVPGLANLNPPLGYASAEFPLAALLGNGPWGAEGFRLLNGLLMGLVALDLAIRLLGRRTPGTLVLLVGVVAAWVPMVALADVWVTGPSQDSAVLALTVVACAYLVDMVLTPRSRLANASSLIVITAVLFLIRSTAVFFVVGTLIVIAVVLVRSRASVMERSMARALLPPAILGALGVVALSLRDVVLSGWIQYPLSVLPVDVPWRTADPTPLRVVTLGFHRDPARMWEAGSDWRWVAPWISRLPGQWETWLLLLLALAAVVLLCIARWSRGARPLRARAMLLAMAPSALAVAAWWLVTPPSFRFAWGPTITVSAIPIGVSLWCLCRGTNRRVWSSTVIIASVTVLSVVSLITHVTRTDLASITAPRSWWLGLTYAVTPIPEFPVRDVPLDSGLTVQVPIETDQCWARFPLCSPQFSKGLSLRTEGLEDGFSGSSPS